MQKSPSNIRNRDSNPRPPEHESSPITTRPGLRAPPKRTQYRPLKVVMVCQKLFCFFAFLVGRSNVLYDWSRRRDKARHNLIYIKTHFPKWINSFRKNWGQRGWGWNEDTDNGTIEAIGSPFEDEKESDLFNFFWWNFVNFFISFFVIIIMIMMCCCCNF